MRKGLTLRRIIDDDGDGEDDEDGGAGRGSVGGGLREVLSPTEADRIQLTAMILSKAEERGGCGFGNIEHLEEDPNDDPRVISIFPLHNKEWSRRVTAQWKEAFSLKVGAISRAVFSSLLRLFSLPLSAGFRANSFQCRRAHVGPGDRVPRYDEGIRGVFLQLPQKRLPRTRGRL